MWITGALISHNATFFVGFSFQTLELLIFVVPLIYTATVKQIEQYLERNINKKHLPKLLSHAIKSCFKLSVAKHIYFVFD